jgi:opacity protein-like surface antigen
MLRKTLLGFAAASTLAVAALAPSAASAGGPNVSIHFGGFGGYGPYYGGYYNDYYGDCFYKEVKVWSHKWHKFVWKTKKVCY